MAKKLPPEETRFKAGQSGNPEGKKPGTLSFKTQMRKWLESKMKDINPETGQEEEMTLLDKLILKQMQKASRGDTRAFEVIKDHIEAKPKQGFDITSAGEKIGEKEIVFRDYSSDKKKKG